MKTKNKCDNCCQTHITKTETEKCCYLSNNKCLINEYKQNYLFKGD